MTIKKWLLQPVPPAEEPVSWAVAVPEPPRLSAPWKSWEQVSQIREALQEHRFLLVCRPEHLTEAEQAQVAALLSNPVGAELQMGRSFLVDWYQIWKDEAGQRRIPRLPIWSGWLSRARGKAPGLLPAVVYRWAKQQKLSSNLVPQLNLETRLREHADKEEYSQETKASRTKHP